MRELTFVEVPIVAYRFAPERTAAVMDETNSWLGRNKQRVAVWVLDGFGVYLIARGIYDALT